MRKSRKNPKPFEYIEKHGKATAQDLVNEFGGSRGSWQCYLSKWAATGCLKYVKGERVSPPMGYRRPIKPNGKKAPGTFPGHRGYYILTDKLWKKAKL